MSSVALDTNVLLRLAETGHPLNGTVLSAIEVLRRAGRPIVLFPQIVYEFWAVSTRSIAANGFGMSAFEADSLVDKFIGRIPILFDNAAVFTNWRGLTKSHAVTGVNSHDMRIVAAMLAHEVTTLLTLNARDFSRYSNIEILTPDGVLASATGHSGQGQQAP